MKKRPSRLDTKTFIEKGGELFLPQLSLDCVIFGFHENELKVLLLEWKDTKQWCLPGGFIYKDEHLNDAAERILEDRTGLDNIHLRQFYTFGHPDRDRSKEDITKHELVKNAKWLDKRFITVGYWALVEFSKVIATPDEISSQCKWWRVKDVPSLFLDHNEILTKAMESLRQNLNDYPVGKELLPNRFTMPELQRLYETILGKKIDRRNFQKKILAMGILDKLPERKQGVAHKAPFLYRFNTKKYQQAMKLGLKFGLS